MRRRCIARTDRRREAGFGVVEVLAGTAVLTIGVLALGGVLVVQGRQNAQEAARFYMLSEARSLMEQIRGTAPDSVVETYSGYQVDLLETESEAGRVITDGFLSSTATVTEPGYVVVAVLARWSVNDFEETLSFSTVVYSP